MGTEAGGVGGGGTDEVEGAGTDLLLDVAGLRLLLQFAPEHAELAAEARRLWSGLIADFTARPPTDVLRVEAEPGADGGRGVVTIRPGPSATYSLSGQVTRRVISHLLGERLLLHAGVIDHSRLGVVLLVGPSGAGKSTAVSVLGRGERYLTDELAVLDPADLTVTGYPKPVSRVLGAPGDRVKQDVAPTVLGLVPALSAGPPDHVVLLERDRGQGDGNPAEEGSGDRPRGAGWEDAAEGIDRAGLGEALVRIAEQSSSLWTVPDGLSRLATLLDRCGGALRLHYREAERLEPLLAQRPPARAEEWEVLVAGAPRGRALEAADRVEAIGLASGVVLLAPGRVVQLPGLAGLVWEELCTSGGMERDELEAAVVAAIGPHPRSKSLIDEVLEELVRTGWVRERLPHRA